MYFCTPAITSNPACMSTVVFCWLSGAWLVWLALVNIVAVETNQILFLFLAVIKITYFLNVAKLTHFIVPFGMISVALTSSSLSHCYKFQVK